MEDPLEVVAAEIADESILLCLDEFMVCYLERAALSLFFVRKWIAPASSFKHPGVLSSCYSVLFLWPLIGD